MGSGLSLDLLAKSVSQLRLLPLISVFFREDHGEEMESENFFDSAEKERGRISNQRPDECPLRAEAGIAPGNLSV